MVETALISEVENVIDNLALQIGVILFLALIITFLLYKLKIGKKRKRVIKKVSRREDEEKVAMVAKIEELQAENVELRERLQSLELKQVEDVGDFTKKKDELEQIEAEVNENLAEILAIKGALNHHRIKVGQLEKEKAALSKEISDLKGSHKNEIEVLKKEFEAEKERIKKEIEEEKGKLEEEREGMKSKAKDTIMRHEKERATLISKLEKENKKLKQAVQKMKEKLGIWESIEDI
ncbi:MAG: hypothetical protein ACE5J5_04180 [Candidatus Hydrothermarchaeales archaeon]